MADLDPDGSSPSTQVCLYYHLILKASAVCAESVPTDSRSVGPSRRGCRRSQPGRLQMAGWTVVAATDNEKSITRTLLLETLDHMHSAVSNVIT